MSDQWHEISHLCDPCQERKHAIDTDIKTYEEIDSVSQMNHVGQKKSQVQRGLLETYFDNVEGCSQPICGPPKN